MSRTVLYLAILTGLVLVIGDYLGGRAGLQQALIFAVLMNGISYWFSDKIVLMMYRAKEVSKEEQPELHDIVERIAAKAHIPKPRVYIAPIDIANAFATGRNPEHAAIAVTSGILHVLNTDELEGVLAHELSHVLNRDILIASVAAVLAGAVSMIARMAMWYGMGGERDRNRQNPLGLLLLLILTPIIATLIQLAISRQREFGADASGAKLIGNGRPLAHALEKLDATAKQLAIQPTPAQAATAHLFITNPFRASSIFRLFSTHPPTGERVRRLLAI